MEVFDYTFTVPAPVEAVRDFHSSTDILKKLTPPPMIMQIHDFGELEDGMEAVFTMWLGPVPLKWVARHEEVSEHGFTDAQVEGPLKSWRHTHRFDAEGDSTTRVREHIEYEHAPGLAGIMTRLMFHPMALRGLFGYRQWVTTRACRASSGTTAEA